MQFKLPSLLMYIILMCACNLNVNAQSGNPTYFQPNVFPSAPNTAAFAKFGNYPVNMYSGVPEISIPLYTIESGELKVPITLAYHASGIRVAEAASWVGLGWSVSCGGSITRKVYGIPDESGYLIETRRTGSTAINFQNNADQDYVRETVEQRQHDNMPDIYSYQIPGHGGKFFYDADSSYKIMVVPRSPLSVIGTHGYGVAAGCSCFNQKFTIRDEHGNTYKLGGTYQEITSAGYAQHETSAWMLESMISQNKKDTVNFTYTTSTPYQLPDGLSETISVEDNLVLINQYGTGYSANSTAIPQVLNNPAVVTEQQLSTVYFKNGKVDFIKASALRTDISAYALDTIKVSMYNFSTKKYEVQKSIVFVKSYFGSGGVGNVRLRLDGIQVLDKAGSIVNQYSFSYNTAVGLPPYGSFARDYWGYYNGKDNSTDLIPQTSIPMISPGGGSYNINIGNPNDPTSSCRNIDTIKMQACILTSITYPTGGHTNFTYQTNRYIDGNNNLQFAGGLRIYKISSYDSPTSATPIVKTYQYDVAHANFFFAPNINVNYGIFLNTQTYRDWATTNNDPQSIGGYVVGATKRVRRYYAQPNEDLDLDGVPVGYTQVTEYTGTSGANIGKSTSTFSWTASTLEGGSGISGIPFLYDYSFSNGELLTKTDYLHKPDGSYQVVKAVTNTYSAFSPLYYDNVGTAMGQRFYNDGALAPGNSAYYPQETPYDDETAYPFGDFAIQSGDTYLTSTTTALYDQSDPTKFVTSAVNYNYDNIRHQQVTRTTHTDSKNNTVVSIDKYPTQYPAGNVVIDTMVNQNILAEPIEKQETYTSSSGTTTTAAQLNQFKFGNLPNTIVPAAVSILNIPSPVTNFAPSTVASGNLTNDSRYVQMISFDQYDPKNNIAQYTPRNLTPVSILWDYNYEKPVAQIKNATNGPYTQVGYTSFEAPRVGGLWIYTGAPVYDVTAPTGRMSYPLSSGSVTTNNNMFDLSQSYVLSLWSNNGAPTVSSGSSLTGIPLRTMNGWTYYEYAVPAGSNITISGTMSIDELRLYPTGAQMITYAYDPSGLRSITDTKGLVSNFEYDPLQRLQNIKDWNGNIVKNFGYHNYDMLVPNDAIAATTFTRDNCPANTAPQSTTYSVPANKYYSSTKASANAEAQYDLKINGQAKADNPTVCGCPVIMVNFTLSNSSGFTGYQATFSGISTPYNFPASGSTVIQVPQGTYATVSVSSSSYSHTFSLTGFSDVVGHSATFNNVSVTTGSNLTLSAKP
jgi:hypothetical protein